MVSYLERRDWRIERTGAGMDDAQLQAQTEAYYLALGRFIHMFGRAEDSLNAEIASLAAHSLKESPNAFKVSRALLGSQTLKFSADTLKILLRILNFPKQRQDDAGKILGQFSEIGKIRNKIVHHGAYGIFDSDYRSVGPTVVKEDKDHKHFYINSKILNAASRDLEIIPTRLSMCITPEVNQAVLKAPADYVKDIVGPWHYKPMDILKPPS